MSLRSKIRRRDKDTGAPKDGRDAVENLSNLARTQRDKRLRRWALRQSMDPSIALSLYNAGYSPIYRLPDEILLLILQMVVNDDWIAFFGLRQVSRLFRRVTGDQQFREHSFSIYKDCRYCDEQKRVWGGVLETCLAKNKPGNCFDRTISLLSRRIILKAIRSRMHSDLFCENCQEILSWSMDIYRLRPACKFSAVADWNWLYCSGCYLKHPSAAFSAEQKLTREQERVCIGRQGHVRLCNHEVITWADIESSINQYHPKTFTDTIRVCRHPSHLGGCKTEREDDDSWPRAELSYVNGKATFLEIRWRPHTHSLLENKGRLYAEGMRSAIQRFRRDAAQFILPARAEFHIPEMEMFPTTKGCDCLRYDRPQLLPNEPEEDADDFVSKRTHCHQRITEFGGTGSFHQSRAKTLLVTITGQ
ncbi:hypothetical protein FALBO_1677 [Fusarium albosuccineum]|uniref:F-box domain-containing protein n=1 Tax=Fusarium albosuccineum TaxID=1237068 RepID=A0A8H4LMR4_9HYPO|nr:hypothetical protein FALBO_1677 [Fusarium albosuccineum]